MSAWWTVPLVLALWFAYFFLAGFFRAAWRDFRGWRR